MTYRPARVPPGAAPAIAARPEPDVITVAQDTVIGMAGCPGCGRLAAVCARRFPCQARHSRFRWRLTMLRLRRAWRRPRTRPVVLRHAGAVLADDVRVRYQRAEHGAGL